MNDLKRRAFALLNAWTTGEVVPLADDLAPHFQEIDRPQATAHGLDGLREKIALFHRAHARVALNVRRQIVQGDQVCTRWTLTADLRTVDDPEAQAPPEVLVQGISWTHFAHGKIGKNIVHRDIVGELMQQGYQWAPGASPGIASAESWATGVATDSASSAKDLLQQMLRATENAASFQDFLGAHLAQDLQGAVAPHQGLSKPETIQRLTEVFALASGGQISLLAAVDEGRLACGSLLLTGKKHDLQYTQLLDPEAEVVVEASIWLELNDLGQIVHLDFIGDMLTPGLAQGMKMVKTPKPVAENAAA